MTIEPTREIGIGISAALLATACVVLLVLALVAGGWWLLALVLLIPLGAASGYGAAVSLRSLPRDADGNPLR